MIHQPLGGFQGQATDISIHAREILRMKDELNMILAELTGQQKDKVETDTDRDYFMSAEEAMDVWLDRLDRYPERPLAGGTQMSRRDANQEHLTCSFCGKSQEDVKKLIAGPAVYICDECIELCNDIIAEEIKMEETLGPDLKKLPKPTGNQRHS